MTAPGDSAVREAAGLPAEANGAVLVAIRAHRVDDHLFGLLHAVRRATSFDVRIVLHDEKGSRPEHPDIVAYSSATLRRLGVETFGAPQWAWHMGDCPLYILFERFPQCRLVVMAEYDVRINFDIDAFVARIGDRVDFTALYAGFSDPKWQWHPAAATWFADPRGSFFPLVGVSRRLAQAALRRRVAFSDGWRAAGADPARRDRFMVHCEALLPTVAVECGFPVADLGRLIDGWDSRFFTGYGLFAWEDDRLDNIAAIHPCFPQAALPAYFAAAMALPFLSAGRKDDLRAQAAALVARGFPLTFDDKPAAVTESPTPAR